MADKEQNRRKFLANLGMTVGAGILSSNINMVDSGVEMEDCKNTPILDIGPFAVMQYRNQADHDIDLTQIRGKNGVAQGQHIIVSGKITDKDCKPLSSAIVEIWQANHFGRYTHEFDNKGEIDSEMDSRELTELIHSTFYGVLTIAKSSKDINQGIKTINLLFKNIKTQKNG